MERLNILRIKSVRSVHLCRKAHPREDGGRHHSALTTSKKRVEGEYPRFKSQNYDFKTRKNAYIGGLFG